MDRKTYIDKLTAQLKQWDDELDLMEAQAQKAEAATRVNYQKFLKDLRQQEKDARKTLDEITKANEDAWKEMSSGAEEAFKTMQSSFMTAMSKFK